MGASLADEIPEELVNLVENTNMLAIERTTIILNSRRSFAEKARLLGSIAGCLVRAMKNLDIHVPRGRV